MGSFGSNFGENFAGIDTITRGTKIVEADLSVITSVESDLEITTSVESGLEVSTSVESELKI